MKFFRLIWKNVFRKKGRFKGEDIARLCLEKEACPRFAYRDRDQAER